MGTSLTGTKIRDTYDALIKVSDNGALDGTLQVLTDGLGNNSALSLSTAGASVGGTLAVSGGITGTLSTAAQPNITSVGTLSSLNVSGLAAIGGTGVANYPLTLRSKSGDYTKILDWGTDAGGSWGNMTINLDSPYQTIMRSGAWQFNQGSTEAMRIHSGGDISFRDSSANEAFYWDASSGGLGIGSSPATSDTQLTVLGNYQSGFYRNLTGGGRGYFLNIGANSPSGLINAVSLLGAVEASNTEGYLAIQTLGSGTLAERMRIDSSGNVGIGTATIGEKLSLKLSNIAGLQNMIGIQNATSTGTLASFGLNLSTDELILGTDYGASFVLKTSGTERMRITSEGYVGIGTGDTDIASGDLIGVLAFNSKDSSTNSSGAIGSIRSYATAAFNTGTVSGDLRFYTQDSGAPNGSLLSGVERMRITSGGYLKASNSGTYANAAGNNHELATNVGGTEGLVFTNSSLDPYGSLFRYSQTTPNNSVNDFLQCTDLSATRLRILSNGGISNYQANDTNLSDERVKTDVSPLGSYWDKIKAIEIVNFKYKDQTHDDFNIGVIAQQVESVAPEFVDIDGFDNRPKLISEEVLDEEGNVIEEAVYEEPLVEPLKAVYTADLYHAAIKVLQEAMARIEVLETELNALKQA